MRQGFTLIEMLVVIAIIALLASLLVPAVTSALAQANDTKCKSHLRQLGQGFLQYSVENKGRIPFQQRDSSTTWHVEVAPYLEGFSNGDFYNMAQEGARPPGVFACPLSENEVRAGNYSDYGMNEMVNDHGQQQQSPQRMLDQVPADVMLLADSVNCDRYIGVYLTQGGLDPRHRRSGVNVLYMDWHVSTSHIHDLFDGIQGDRRYQAPWGWEGWEN